MFATGGCLRESGQWSRRERSVCPLASVGQCDFAFDVERVTLPATEIRVFVLTKPDGFRTKVIISGRYSVERLLTSASDWNEHCRNVPSILIRQFGAEKGDKPSWKEPSIPYPAQVVSCLNTAWERAETHAEQVPGFGIGDGLGLLLEDGVVLNAIATRAIRTLVANTLCLVVALG